MNRMKRQKQRKNKWMERFIRTKKAENKKERLKSENAKTSKQRRKIVKRKHIKNEWRERKYIDK